MPAEEQENLYETVDDLFVDKRKKENELDEEAKARLIVDMKNVLRSESGRRVIWHIISSGNIFSARYFGRALDQANDAGIRAHAAEVFALALKADPTYLQSAVTEQLTPKKEGD